MDNVFNLLNRTKFQVLKENYIWVIDVLKQTHQSSFENRYNALVMLLRLANFGFTDDERVISELSNGLATFYKEDTPESLIEVYCKHCKTLNELICKMNEKELNSVQQGFINDYNFFVKKVLEHPENIIKALEEGKLNYLDEKIYIDLLEYYKDEPDHLAIILSKFTSMNYTDNKALCATYGALRLLNSNRNKGKYCEVACEVAVNLCSNRTCYVDELTRSLLQLRMKCKKENRPEMLIDFYKEHIDKLKKMASSDSLSCEIDEINEDIETLKNALKKYPDKLCETFCEEYVIENFGYRTFSTGFIQLYLKGKDISEYLKYHKDALEISVEDYKNLISNPNIPKGLKVCIVCKDASELSSQDLDGIDDRFECQVRFDTVNLNPPQKTPYTIEQYQMCRQKIDELLESVVIPPNDDMDREKKIFGQVVLRLANHMKYNNSHVSVQENIEKIIETIKNMNPEERKNNQKTLKALEDAYNNLDYTTSRNMIGGLLQGECVCAGYAEILRNVLACCGIECRYVSGFPAEEEKSGHAWNQAKLDGKWYNVDLTWARDAIVDGKWGDKHLMNLLATDEEFNDVLGHSFNRNKGVVEPCNSKIGLNEIIYYIQRTPEKGMAYREFLNGAADNLRLEAVKEMARAIANDGKDVTRRKENGDFEDKGNR